MEKEYRKRIKGGYMRLVKSCPGIPELYFKGKIIARGSSLTGSDPRYAPTKEDWEYCESVIGD